MGKKDILHKVDHTLLGVNITKSQIQELIKDAIFYETASVCIPPSYIAEAKKFADGQMKICTVIGFPNGYMTTETKVFETTDAIKKGADEIDMVINIAELKNANYGYIKDEIRQIKEACQGHILKVIIETALLTEDEKIKMCELVTEAGADFIKTSTGFSTGGATIEDIRLFKEHVGEGVQIKAAGGITSFDDAEKMIECGASRLGTSRLVKLMKSEGIDTDEY